MMKKIGLLLLFAAIPLLSISQNFKGGLLAGLATTQVDGDGLGGYHRAGAIGGVWVSLPINKTWALRTELKLIQKGSYERFKDAQGGTLGYYSLRLNYVEMPFLVEYYRWENIIPYIGLSGGYLWHYKEQNNGYDNPVNDETPFRKGELGVHGGVEYILNRNFSFGATFSYSVLPFRLYGNNIRWKLDYGQYNRVLQFLVRYHF